MEWQGGNWRREAGETAWQRSLGTCRPQTMSLVLAFALLLPRCYLHSSLRERTVKGQEMSGGGRVVANGSRLGYGS